MKKMLALTCFAALAACDPYPDGYYDAAGNFHSYTTNQSPRAPLPGGRDVVTGSNGDYYYHDRYYDSDPYPVPNSTTTITRTYTFDRPGYYDYSGYYIGRGEIPRRYYPPHGMCRVWYPDREYPQQPAVESCDDIQYRVPSGAYVIFGG